MIEVGRATPADALYIVSSLVLSPGSQIVGFALQDRVFRDLAVGLRQRRAGIAEAVDNRVAAVAPEILQRHLDPGRRLPALVLGKMQHALDLPDCLAVEAFRGGLCARRLPAGPTCLAFGARPSTAARCARSAGCCATPRGGRPGKMAGGAHGAPGPAPPRGLRAVPTPAEPIARGLVETLDRIEPAVHVAIERGVADRHFR